MQMRFEYCPPIEARKNRQIKPLAIWLMWWLLVGLDTKIELAMALSLPQRTCVWTACRANQQRKDSSKRSRRRRRREGDLPSKLCYCRCNHL